MGSIEVSLPLELSAVPDNPTAGEPVHLSVLNAPSAATDYRWKLAGHHERSLRLSSTPRVTLQFETPGVQRVTVLTTDKSVTYEAKLTLRVRLKPNKAARSGGTATQKPQPSTPNRIAPLGLSAVPDNPMAGEPVHLSVLNAPSAATDYRWKLRATASTRSASRQVPE